MSDHINTQEMRGANGSQVIRTTFVPDVPALNAGPTVYLPGGAVRYQHGAPEGVQSSGVTRYQHGAQEAHQPVHVGPQTRVHGGVTRFTHGAPEGAQTTGVSSYQVSYDGVPGGSVAATLMRSGTSMTVELEPGNPMSRTLVSLAEKDGLIRKGPDGRYEDVQQQAAPQGNQKAPDQAGQEQQEANPNEAFFTVKGDQDWAQAIEPLSQSAYDSAVASAVGVVANGNDIENTIKALSSAEGMEPEQARAYVKTGMTHYQQVTDRAMASMGLTGDRLEEAYSYMRDRPAELQNAIQRLVHARDLGAFKELAVKFKVSTPDPLQGTLAAAGWQTAVDRDTGDLLIRQGTGNWRRASEVMGARGAA